MAAAVQAKVRPFGSIEITTAQMPLAALTGGVARAVNSFMYAKMSGKPQILFTFGRMKLRFPGLSKLEPLLVGRAEQARENYREKFEAHSASIAQLARRLDWPLIVHETDKPANAALTAAYIAMSGAAL